MNRTERKAARENRGKDKWTGKHRLLPEANEEKRRKRVARPEEEEEPVDLMALLATQYRERWEWRYRRGRESYEDATSIPPMRYTDEPPPPINRVGCADAVVVFSVKVTELSDGLEWPLDVYGVVAVRDSADYNRNLLFNRTRDNCQTLTAEDASLLLTGPSRAIMKVRAVDYDVELKVKGESPSQDKLLSFFVDKNYYTPGERRQGVRCYTCSSQLSTVVLTIGHLEQTVEATMTIRVTEGSWPTRYHGRFAARISNLDDRDMVLLDSRDGAITVTSNGTIELTRRVVSVEENGELRILVNAWLGDGDLEAGSVANGQVLFAPRRSGRSKGVCDVGFSRIEVTVAWSLVVNR
ncbi:hypothetical protein ACQJBY_011935 [Aegilops geniculata]